MHGKQSMPYHSQESVAVCQCPICRLVKSKLHDHAVHFGHRTEFKPWHREQTPRFTVKLNLNSHCSVVRSTWNSLSQPQGSFLLKTGVSIACCVHTTPCTLSTAAVVSCSVENNQGHVMALNHQARQGFQQYGVKRWQCLVKAHSPHTNV